MLCDHAQLIDKDERHDGRNEHIWDFQGELVAAISRASTWQQYLHMNVEVTDENMSKRLQKNLIEHQWALTGHEDIEYSSISPHFDADFEIFGCNK
jgi:hypothetical protein